MALANNQWELEAENWFKIALADLQQTVVEQATGPTDPSIARFATKPNAADQETLCTNQKVSSTLFMNFSVLGLVLTLVIGGLIMLVAQILPPIIQRFAQDSYKTLEWKMDNMFQLQRLAYEGTQSCYTAWD
jgi:hypothetical protein